MTRFKEEDLLAIIKPSYVILRGDEIVRTITFNSEATTKQLQELTRRLGGDRYIATWLDDAVDIETLLVRYSE